MAEVLLVALGNAIGLLNGTNTLIDTLSKKVSKFVGVGDKIQGLSEDLALIQAEVENSPSIVSYRLWQLEDASHDATQLLNKLHSASWFTRAINQENLQGDIGKLRASIEELSRQVSQLADSSGSRPTQRSQPSVKNFFGYSEQCMKLELCLLTDSISGACDAHPVVGIIGHGGMGKTELARWAFKHAKVRSDFQLRIWVAVSGNLTKNGLSCEILEGSDSHPEHLKDVSELGKKLTEKLGVGPSKRKKCLVVLDDVSYDESAASDQSRAKTWDAVLIPFQQYGGSGSRILVTTRAQICLRTLGAAKASIDLHGINNNSEIIRLLKMTAFGDDTISEGLHSVLHTYVGRLGGSPWVATEVGWNMKGNTNTAEWETTFRIERLADHFSSYMDLPLHLRRCFAFCSIFPDGWEFEREKLAMMWVAHDFVAKEDAHGFVSKEDAALQYFKDLLQRSLFHIKASSREEEKDRYVIHKHIHSMLRRVEVAPKYHLMLEGTCEEPDRTVRHLSCTTDSNCLCQFRSYPDAWKKKVRTLLLYNNDTHSGAIDQTLLDELLQKFKGVRVLDFSRTTGITQLPESITGLTNVRYLGLPDSIEELGKINNNNFNRLETLHAKIKFSAKGSMSQLKNVHSRVSDLRIQGLETVKSKGKSKKPKSSKLEEKKQLKVLSLVWDYKTAKAAERSADLEVLDDLQPAPSIQTLRVTGYKGETLPAWLKNPHLLTHLSSLYLNKCTNLGIDLPDVGGLPALRFLHLDILSAVKRINSSGAFKSLEELELSNMDDLEGWDADPSSDGVILFPKLETVKILDCSKLSTLLGLQSCRKSLVHLTVSRCPILSQSFDIKFPKLTPESLESLGRECPGLKFN